MSKRILKQLILIQLLLFFPYVLSGTTNNNNNINQNTPSVQSTPYKKLDYDEIHNQFKEMAKQYPDLFHLKYIDQESNIDFSRVQCGEGINKKNCEFFYAEISNFTNNSTYINQLPQVIYLGGLLGNNTIGPNIVTYFGEYLLKNSKSFKIQELLQNRLIVLYPIPNPQGFIFYNPNETQINSKTINVENDFPFYLQSNNQDQTTNNNQMNCLESVSAKALVYLFSRHIFTIGATFGLGQIPSISYTLPESDQSSNNNVLKDIQNTITQHLKNNSPGNVRMLVPEYSIELLNSSYTQSNKTFYEWSNLLSFKPNNEQSTLPLCKDVSLSQQIISQYSHKCLMYKIETNKQDPNPQSYGDRESSSNIYSSKIGHIARNIQLSLELAEMASPYLSTRMKAYNNNNIYIEWQVRGCFIVSETSIYYRIRQSNINYDLLLQDYNNIEMIQKDFILIDTYYNQTGTLVSDLNQYSHSWTFNNQTLFDVIITAQCDQSWNQQNNNNEYDPIFLQLRNNSTFNITNNQYSLTSKKLIISTIPSIQSLSTVITPGQQMKALKEQVHKETFKFWMGILIGLGGLMIIFLTIFIYYRCRKSYQDMVDLKLLSPKSQIDGLELQSNQTNAINTSEINQLNLTKIADFNSSKMDNDFANFASIQ